MNLSDINNKLTLYVSHSTAYDFKSLLYSPLRESILNSLHNIILPHEHDDKKILNSKSIIQSSNLIIAEVSYPSTGQGIELGWAEMFSIPIICIHQADKKYSSSLSIISNRFISYRDQQELVDIINNL